MRAAPVMPTSGLLMSQRLPMPLLLLILHAIPRRILHSASSKTRKRFTAEAMRPTAGVHDRARRPEVRHELDAVGLSARRSYLPCSFLLSAAAASFVSGPDL